MNEEKTALLCLRDDLAGIVLNIDRLDSRRLDQKTQTALTHLTEAYNFSASEHPDAHSYAVQRVDSARLLLEDNFAKKCGPAANKISETITAIISKPANVAVLQESREPFSPVAPLSKPTPNKEEMRDFVAQVVKAYSQVFDDPTAGGKAVDDGVAVPAIAIPKQKPTTTAEIEAVKQVQKAYEATMAVADLLEAGKEDEALKQYTIARKEATKAFHALAKCPEYRPEAREALGKALKPHERDLPVGNRDRGHQR
ncbi:hypothetical protein [Acidithiobacillus ferriphilus]|uniref:hypothetical protein n=1 Tax=Acidithiobacillus ferriphilus TaxID=1689834 RepID=UPI001C072474|nr:hypothetical protein [Acidithiobacillus ferriphilus]MBU2853006.1 hypothetical protein [Acidithiobacillus ferriphilus]